MLESAMKQIHLLRYNFVRYFHVPVSFLPPGIFPFIGGRTLIELLIFGLVLAISVEVWFTTNLFSSGSIASAAGAIAVLFGLRNNLLTLLFGISFERALYWHKIVAMSSLVIGGCHAYMYFHEDSEEEENELSGFVLLGFMFLTSFLYIFKRYQWLPFEFFYYSHILLYAMIAVVSFIHGAVFLGLVGVAWLLDLGMRYCVKLTSIDESQVEILLLPANVVRVSWPKSERFQYTAGQYIFLNVPSLSLFEYHPFTLSSAPHEPRVSVHVRALGDWTKRLEQLAGPLGSGPKHFPIRVEGPFGILSIPLRFPREYQVVLLVTGGIGVTPAQSIFNDLVHKFETENKDEICWPLRKLVYIWSVKDRAIVSMDSNRSTVLDLHDHSSPTEGIPLTPLPPSSSTVKIEVQKPVPTAEAPSLVPSDRPVAPLPELEVEDLSTNSFQPDFVSPTMRRVGSANKSGLLGVVQHRVHPDQSASEPVEQQAASSIPPVTSDLESGDQPPFQPSSTSMKMDYNFFSNQLCHVEFFLTTRQAHKNPPSSPSSPPSHQGDLTIKPRGHGQPLPDASSLSLPPTHVDSDSMYLRHGRPDLLKIFQETELLCLREGISRVGVVTCGPLGMVQDVHKLCAFDSHRHRLSDGGSEVGKERLKALVKELQEGKNRVKFELHVEEFDM